MKRYRFYKIENGEKLYLMSDMSDMSYNKQDAGLFTEEDWDMWGNEVDLERDEISEDEMMRLIGAPMLPGF